MKRRSIFLAVLILAIAAMIILIINKKTVSNDTGSLGTENSLTEDQSLLESNSSAANAQISATVPAISDTDQLLWGDRNAALKMVVYEDLTSVYSFDYNEILKKAEKEFDGKLAVYVRPYFESDNSQALEYQTAVFCAGKEGKFNEMRNYIFEQKPLVLENIVDGAEKIRLNKIQFSDCLNNSENQVKIARSVEDIRMIAVFGAPTSILDGEVITGARALDNTKNGEGEEIEGLRSIVNRHLAR